MLSDKHDSNRAKYLMTNWLSTDELRIGQFVKFLFELFESHFKTYNT